MRLPTSPSLRLRVVVFLLSIAFFTPSALRAQTQPQTPRPLPATRYIPSHDFDTQNIKLDLRFDWEHDQAIGIETITLAPLVTDLRRIELDAANMTFNSIKLASGAQLKFEFDQSQEKLRITLDRAYQPSDVLNILIDYHTNGAQTTPTVVSASGGLVFIKPNADDPKRPRQIWSQGESEYNHYWFPCYDHPNDFTTTEIVATVEKPLMVISNGKLLSTKENKDNTRTFDWKIEQPHATYLTSIVVGEYVAVEGSYAGIPVISYVYPSELTEGRVTTSRLPAMVKFFSEKTGVKYPYAKYAQTMAHDFGGGMENISATTQTDNMIHDARAERDETSDSLESHELAHQWFGDYVTCRSWADLWLNESFATYFQAMWDEHSLGHDDFLYRDVKGNQDAYYRVWARGLRRPIVTENYANPDAVFDTYVYPRGGAVLHMLRKNLGDANWWRAINHYLTKYAHQPVSTEQFRIAIEEATGQSMDWFFDEWLYKMGHPVFRVTQAYDPAAKILTLTVKQEQKPDPNYAYPQVTLFQTPVEIEIVIPSETRIERVMIEPKEEQSFTFRADSEPQIVNFDYGNTLIKELHFQKPTAALIYQLSHDEDVMGRMWALGQLAERRKDRSTTDSEKESILKAVTTAVSEDKFWGMRSEAVAVLQNGGDAVKSTLIAATKDQNPEVRARAVRVLGARKDPALANIYQQLLNDESYRVIRAAAEVLGQTKSESSYESLVKLVDTPSWRDTIRASGLAGLAALGDKRALDVALKYAATGNSRQIRTVSINMLAAMGKNDPRVFPVISEAFLKSASPLNLTLFNTSGRALVELGDQRALAVFEQAGQKVSDERAKSTLQQLTQQLKQKTEPATSKTPGE